MTFHVTIERGSHDTAVAPGFEPLFEEPGIDISYLADDRGPGLEPGDLRGVDAYVSYSYELTAASLDGVDTLRIVTRSGAGYDNLDVDALTEHGVLAAHAPQGPTASVGQAAAGMIISCAHNFPRHEYVLRRGDWRGDRSARRASKHGCTIPTSTRSGPTNSASRRSTRRRCWRPLTSSPSTCP
jgi:phosphoglycerate dehydrogenase-like enzyme